MCYNAHMKRVILTAVALVAVGAGAVTVHRSFSNGYPAEAQGAAARQYQNQAALSAPKTKKRQTMVVTNRVVIAREQAEKPLKGKQHSKKSKIIGLSRGNESCRIDLVGGCVVSYRVDGAEVLWNDDPPQRTAKDWAHGGIPICWPWFGDDGKGNIHGIAWRMPFCLETRSGADGSEVQMALAGEDAVLTHRVWVNGGLHLESKVKNLGTNDYVFTVGYHPYFRVTERDAVSVEGVDGLLFEDDPSFPNLQKGVWRGTLRVTNYVDRIFATSTNDVRICVRGVSRGRDLELTFGNFTGVNVWNPEPEKNCSGVVPGDSWRRFVCVEPVRSGTDGRVRLAPQEEATFKFTIRTVRKRKTK